MPLLVQPLPKECAKAAKIFQSFVDSGNNGLDGVVPRGILERAKGFAIFSVVKAGFIVSARAGSGIVIARLEDGSWSAPSAIGTAGMGVGTQAGAEVTDFLIVLNTRAALKTFMSAGSLTLGGNLSIAVGPLGRNGEAIGSFSSSGTVAAMYSYSKTRGLFGGVSLEGSVVVERQDANAQAYGRDAVSVKALLSGTVPVPQWAQGLVSTLESCTGMPGGRTWVQDTPADLSPAVERGDPMAAAVANSGRYTFAGLGSPGSVTPGSNKKKKGSFPPMNWGRQKSGGSYFAQQGTTDDRTDPFKLSNQEYRSDHTGFGGADDNTKKRSGLSKSDDLTRSMRALALSKPAPTIPDSRSSPAAQQAPTFETHFDSDFVPESTPAPAGLSSSFNGLHPTFASASQPKQPEVDLLDFGDHKPSQLDFDPLGPGSRMQYGQSTHPHTHTQSLSGMPVPMPAPTKISRPAPDRASSNPFFGLDAFPAPSASNTFSQSSVASTSPFTTPALTSSPPPIRPKTFSPTLSSQSIRDIRQNQTPLFGPDPPFAHAQRPSIDSIDELYTPRAPSAPISYSNQTHPAPTRRDSGGPQRKLSVRPELAAPLPSWAQGRAVALFDFEAVQPGDLSFRQGDVITLLEKSGTTDTWWKGWVEGRTGIFPANFVEVA